MRIREGQFPEGAIRREAAVIAEFMAQFVKPD
jgi:hypothetical protein